MKKNVDKNFIFTHGQDANNRRFTLATKVEDNRFTIGVSVCSMQDNFCRKIGRNIAKTRAVGRPIETVDISKVTLSEKQRRDLAIKTMFEIKADLEADATKTWERNL